MSISLAADALKRAHSALAEKREADAVAALEGARIWLDLEVKVAEQPDAVTALATVRACRDYLFSGCVHQAIQKCEDAMHLLDEIADPALRADNARRMFDTVQQDAEDRWKFVEDDDHPDPEEAMAAAEYWGDLREGR